MALPGYEAQRVEEMQWGYSLKQQSDYITPLVPATDIDQTHPVNEANVAEITKELRSDKAKYGKGHEFATAVREVARDLRFTRSFDGSSAILGWLFAFAMGKITTTQPDAVGATSTYHHAITFFDPDTEGTAVMPVTTVLEKVSTGIKRLLESLAVTNLTITAEGFEHLVASADFVGSGKISTSSATIPTMPTGLAYLSSNMATIKLGDSAEDISTRIRSWSVAIANNPKEARGYYPSSGLYRGRLEVGSRSIVPSLVVDLAEDDDLLADFLANTELALDIMCEGAVIEDTYKHYLRLRFPSLLYRAIPIEENDGVWTYNISFDEETVLYNASDTPAPLVYVEIQNDVEEYLELAT